MKFDYHLFISYAHVDNKPTSDDSKGWVTRFHKCLESYLGHYVGEDARIWRDDKVRGNDEFGKETMEQLPQSAILLSILSPRYLKSDWCIKEVNTFCRKANQSTGLKIGNKYRVFRVHTMSVGRNALDVFPDISDKSIGYEFYQQDERGRESWLDPDLGSGEEYRLRILYLAKEIAGLIHGMKTAAENDSMIEESAAGDKKPTVYLAECSYDQRENREKVASSLRGHGYRILPGDRLPLSEAEYTEQAGKLLDECQLSIHLIGSSYGVVPDGPSGKSNVVLQNELAVERFSTLGMKRLIWMPPNLKSDNPLQQSFLDALRQTPEAQFGADLIESDLETLKGTMHRTLMEIQQQKAKLPNATDSSETTVYLVCAQRDRSATIELRKFLKHQGYKVKIPVFEGDAATVRQVNEANFNAADAVILFYGEADEAWRATIQNDLTRLGGLREGPSLEGSYIFLAGPESLDKTELITMEEDGVIDGLSGFSEAIMAGFTRAIPA